jgi:hypothetical protein
MSPEAIVAIIGLALSILLAAFKLGREMAALKAAVEPFAGVPDRVTKLEFRTENLEQNQAALFELAGATRH